MKGMQAISRGSGFGGTVKYGLVNANGDLEGRIIGGNMSGTTAKELAAEFGLSRKLRPDVKKPVWHNCLRSPKDEKLTDEEFEKIGNDYMKRMGFTDAHQRVYLLHDDEKGRHIHIVASRIGLDGQLYLGKNENLKSTRIIQRLERDYGLIQTKGPDNVRGDLVMPDIKRPTQGEVGKFERTGETTARFSLAALIDKAISDKPTATTFAERLTLSGVEVRANFNKNGLNGFSFSLDGIPFKGSQLGKQYTGQALLERGLTYVKDRDHAYLRQLSPAATSDGKHDRPAKNVEGVQPRSADQRVDSAITRDAIDIRRTSSGADRADYRADNSDLGATPGRAERSEDERRDAEISAEASREAGIPAAGSGTERPAIPGVAVAPAREHSHQHGDIGSGISSGVEVSAVGLILTGDKGSDELIQAAHSGRLKAEREVLSRQKKQHVEDMANAKKRQIEFDKPASNRLSRLADRSMDSTWRANEIQAFAKATGASKFEITCSGPNPAEKPVKKVFSAEQLQNPATIRSMAHMSAKRFDVSIRPDPASGVILLKGLDADHIKKLEAIGLQPAAVVDIAGKKEAWITTGSKLSPEERTALTQRLETLTGVEQKHCGAGGLVGFSIGQKAVGLTACPGQVAPAAAALLADIKAEIFEANAATQLAKKSEEFAVLDKPLRDFLQLPGLNPDMHLSIDTPKIFDLQKTSKKRENTGQTCRNDRLDGPGIG